MKSGFLPEAVEARSFECGRIIDTPHFTATAAVLQHHGASIGYAITKPPHVNIWGNRRRDKGLPLGPWPNVLKQAVRDGRQDEWAVELADGGGCALGTLRDLVSTERGQRIAYVTDVRDNAANRQAIIRLSEGADLFMIEASFAARHRDKADARAHLTTSAAGETARAAGARRVEPFHFSPRYDGHEAEMIAEVEAA